MKKITFYIIALMLSSQLLMAQTPDAFNYQAVARTSAGAIMDEQNIAVEITILESGSAIFTEEHNLTTNQHGLFSLSIGTGAATLGDFATIDWSSGNFSLQVALDENAGSNFVVMGSSPLLSVPFAMHAKTAENTFSGNYSDLNNTPDLSDYDTNVNDDFSGNYDDLNNKPVLIGDVSGDIDNNAVERIQGKEVSSNMPANGQVLKWDDTAMQWIPADDALGAAGSTDGVVSSVGVTGTTTKTITLNRTEGLGTLTATFTDENTQLLESDVDAMVSNNGYLTSFTEVDGSTTNELQDLSIAGTTLSIENGNSVNLAAIQDGFEPNTDTQLSEAEVDAYVANNGYLTSFTEVDGSTTNELQDLSISGTTLSIENGNSVNLAGIQDGYEANTDNQTITLSGNSLSISNGNSINLSSIDTDTQLSEAEVDAYVADNGYLTSFTEVDGSTTNELQDLTLSGTTLSIENGNSVNLAIIQDGFEPNTDTQLSEAEVDAFVANNGYLTSFTEVDGSTTNELQDLSITGTTLSIENGNSVNLAGIQDGYEANTDNQTITLSGNNLSISNGNSINLSSIDTDTQLSEAEVDAYVADNGYLTSFTEVDGSTSNELQTLNLSGNTLSISSGNSVNLSSLGGSDAQGFDVFTLIGTTLYASLDNDGEATKTVDLSSLQDGGAFETSGGVTSNSVGNYGTNDFVFGAPSLSYDGDATHASRIIFDKNKSAFRAGYDNAYAWSDPTKLGYHSFASGKNCEATAMYTFAHGFESKTYSEAAIAMGYQATALSRHTVVLGYQANAGAAADYGVAIGKSATTNGMSAVAIGEDVEAGGMNSVALGNNAIADGDGAFALGDYSSNTLTNNTDNSFAAAFMGGYRLYTVSNMSIGARLVSGGNSWSTISDSTKKENFQDINGEEILNKISQFNLTSWNYKGQDASLFRHYGPMAQDFYHAFGNDGIGTVGCDTLINTSDIIGINFTAIHALEERTQELRDTQAALNARINEVESLKQNLDMLKAEIEDLQAIKKDLEILKAQFATASHN